MGIIFHTIPNFYRQMKTLVVTTDEIYVKFDRYASKIKMQKRSVIIMAKILNFVLRSTLIFNMSITYVHFDR